MLYDSKGNEIASRKTTYGEISDSQRGWMVHAVKKMLEPCVLLDMLPIIYKANSKDMYERTVKMKYKSDGLKFRRPEPHEVD